jgi:hypothetical protein
MIPRLLRLTAIALYALADSLDRLAERMAPSVVESHDLAPALRVERFSELERETFRQQTMCRGNLRVVPGTRA